MCSLWDGEQEIYSKLEISVWGGYPTLDRELKTNETYQLSG